MCRTGLSTGGANDTTYCADGLVHRFCVRKHLGGVTPEARANAKERRGENPRRSFVFSGVELARRYVEQAKDALSGASS